MTTSPTPPTLKDYLTGAIIPDVGAESHRQAVLRFLVEKKGYSRDALWVDAPIHTLIAGRPYTAKIDLIVKAGTPLRPVMAFKCCAGSLGSREREILAAARIFGQTPIRLAVVSDGRDAILLDTVTGKPHAHGLAALPSPQEATRLLGEQPPRPYPEDRMEREKLIFRTYDQDNVNIIRPAEKA
jgi:hypothetical protein